MARTIASLAVSITSRTKGLEKGLRAATRRVEAFGRDTARMGRNLAGIAVGGGAGLLAFTKGVSDSVDTLADMGTRIRMGTNDMIAFKAVFERSGVSIDTFVRTVSKLQLNAAKAAQGNEKLKSAFQRLNIDVDQFNKLDPKSQILLVAEGLKNIRDPAERAAVAAAVFGLTWSQVLPILKDGAGALNDQVRGVQQFTKLSQEQLGALDRFDQAWNQWKAAIDGVKLQLGALLAGPGAQFLDWMRTSLPSAIQQTEIAIGRALNLVDKLKQSFSGGGAKGGAVVGGILGSLLGQPMLGAGLGAVLGSQVPGAVSGIQQDNRAKGRGFDPFSSNDLVRFFEDLDRRIAEKFSSPMNQGAMRAADLFKGAFDGITPTIQTQNLVVQTGERSFGSVAGTPTAVVPNVGPPGQGAATKDQAEVITLLRSGNDISGQMRDLLRKGVPAVAQ